MAKKNDMTGVHPALLAPMKNTKPIKLTPAERAAAKRNLEKAKKRSAKYDVGVPTK